MNSFNSPNIFPQFHPGILNRYLTVQTAAEATGYNIQYMRRVLHSGTLVGFKICQIGLIKMESLET